MYTKEQLTLVSGMNKQRLREGCRAAKITSYSKMTVAQMRGALQRHIEREMAATQAPVAATQAESASPMITTIPTAETSPAAVTAPAVAEKPKKPIAPPLEERNGVRKPREGGVCRAVWDALDKMHASGTVPTSNDVRDLATAKDWNQNNATIELGRWRKFNGIARPAQSKGKEVAAAA